MTGPLVKILILKQPSSRRSWQLCKKDINLLLTQLQLTFVECLTVIEVVHIFWLAGKHGRVRLRYRWVTNRSGLVDHHGRYKSYSYCYTCHLSLLALSSGSSVSSQLVLRCLLPNVTPTLFLSRSLLWIGCGRRRLAFTRLRRSSVSTENASESGS